MKDPLGVSPSRGNQGTTRGKEKILLTSVGIEPSTSHLKVSKISVGRASKNIALIFESGQKGVDIATPWDRILHT